MFILSLLRLMFKFRQIFFCLFSCCLLITFSYADTTFSLAVKPQHVTVAQGSVTQTNVEVMETGEFDARVYLEIHSGLGRSSDLDGFRFDFSGANAGYKAAANKSDLFSAAQHWIVVPDNNNKSISQLTITTFPDTVPGEYTVYIHGQRDGKKIVQAVRNNSRGTVPFEVDDISKAQAELKITVTADPAFIDLIEPVEFGLTTASTLMVTPPSGYPHMNEIYVTAERSLETITLQVSVEPKVPGLSVGLDRKRVKQERGPNMLLVAVTDEAKPGTYYATITATSKGSNNKTNTVSTRIEIIVPEKKKDSKVSLGDDPKPIKVNCVGSSCPSEPINAFCLGINCQSSIDLNCSGSRCTDNLDLICIDGSCPSSLDLNCDATACDGGGVNFFCGEGGCANSPGEGLISDINATTPSTLTVNCSGQGCGDSDIIGICYGDTCPSSIDLNCSGTGCADTVEIYCLFNSCSQDFNQICFGEFCSSQLQFNCDGDKCDAVDNLASGMPYLTGASPSSTALVSPDTGSTNSASSQGNVEIKPVVTPRGSSEAIPASSADLVAIRAAAQAISANAGACNDAECPIIDCATAGKLLQGLINAEANLDEMYKWLIQASDDAMAHLQSLQGNDIITGEQLAQAITAQGLHQFLHNMGSILLDLAALTDTLENLAKDGLDPSKIKNLDTLYESLKTFESAVDTIADQGIKTEGTGPINDLTGGADELLGLENTSVGSLKSDLSDTLSAIENFKDGKPWKGARNVGQIVGRVLKDLSAAEMKARQARIDEYMESLGQSNVAIASSMAFLQKTNDRRFAAEDALSAVRAAKNSLMACMNKACGAVSLTRPDVNTGFSGWGSALRHFNGLTQAIFSGLNGSFSVKDQCPGVDTAVSLFTGDGFLGGAGISLTGGGNTRTTPVRTVEAKCPRCQSIADKIATNLTEMDYWNAEKAAIEEKLRQAETLRERLKLLESRKASNRRTIASLVEGLNNANALGFNWGPNLAIMLREAEARGRDLTRQMQEMEREIARLEADKDRLETIQARLSELSYKRRNLREDLRYCEEEYCKSYDKDNENVGRFIGEIFGVEVLDVKHVTGNNPFNRDDPLEEESNSSSSTTTNSSTTTTNNFVTGSYSCGANTCGIASFNLSKSGSTTTLNSFGANGSTPFTVNSSGNNGTSNSNNLTILGAPQHQCTIQHTAPKTITLVCKNNFGAGPGSCTNTCN